MKICVFANYFQYLYSFAEFLLLSGLNFVTFDAFRIALCQCMPCFHFALTNNFRYSFSKFGVNTPLPMLSSMSLGVQKRPPHNS